MVPTVTSRCLLTLLSLPALFLCAALAGCTTSSQDGAADADPPALGAADGRDTADRSCQVVLRSLARQSTGPGYETDCSSGSCWFVWRGTIDVAEAALTPGTTVAVLYHPHDGGYFQVDATPSTSAASASGMRRFDFAVSRDIASPGWSATSLARTRFEVMPFLRTARGDRKFDHNRNAGDFENYLLASNNGWKIDDDGATCGGRVRPSWLGNVGAERERYSPRDCAAPHEFSGPLSYTEWERQRAARTNMCFEVYAAGVTDRDNPDLWRTLDVQAIYHWHDASPSAGQRSEYVRFTARVGNNAQYGLDLRHFDPFQIISTECPSAPIHLLEGIRPGAQYLRADAVLDLYFIVNGVELRPGDGAFYQVKFEGQWPTRCLPSGAP